MMKVMTYLTREFQPALKNLAKLRDCYLDESHWNVVYGVDQLRYSEVMVGVWLVVLDVRVIWRATDLSSHPKQFHPRRN